MSGRTDRALERLRKVRTADDLLRYFIEELDWPLDDETLLEDEDLTFDFDLLEELGVPRMASAHIERVRQVRPFTVGQPWGIFFVDVAGQRLPLTRLREFLNRLISKRRSGTDVGHRTWALDDLLFVVTTGKADTTELHLLVFYKVEGKVEFRCISWRPADSTGRLRRLAQELLPQMSWPIDEEDVHGWREAWRNPFTLRPGQVIASATRLADRMARTARDLRDQITDALEAEAGEGPFSELMGDIRQQLVADVDADRFADMCSQTLVYGLLGSRVTDPDGFGATPVLSAVPLSNPFLSSLFERIHGEATTLDLEGSGLEQLIADLRETDVEAILDDFGSTAKGGDPVIHFYEEFLKQYDRKMRADAGAFYTPEPVVEFMVRGVDEILRTRFGLEAGIADDASWQDVAERFEFEVPEGVDATEPFISMIDPATGTGTFLVHWLRQAKRSFERAHPGESWRQHLGETVLPSMHAFEFMLGPYTIAHLKLALQLHDEGLPTDAAQILLTDTLDHDPPQMKFGLMEDPVAAEGGRAARLKKDERFTVIIGNPPYHREKKAVGDTGKRKGGVVRHGAAGVRPLLDDVTKPMREADLGVHIKNLYNDYVYFWRWAVWQATELPPGPGVVVFITASSYLDGKSMGGLRSFLRNAFDELLIVDLGGEGLGALVEENVFDIKIPVTIAFGLRSTVSDSTCTVRYMRVSGTRQEKLERLNALSVLDLTAAVPGRGIEVFIPISDSEYRSWPSLIDLFPWCRSGTKLSRTWPIGPTATVLRERWQRLVTQVPRQRGKLLKETTERTVSSTPMPLLVRGNRLRPIRLLDRDDDPEGHERYGYRSFDRQWIIADHRLADRAAPILWHTSGDQQVFLTTLTSTRIGRGPVLTATPYVPDLHHFRGSYGAQNVMPMYRDPTTRVPNLPDGLLETLGGALGQPVTVKDLVAYAYALQGTGAFSDRFADELAEMAGPVRVPVTRDPGLFTRAVRLGHDLLWYHTWGERFGEGGHRTLPAGSATETSSVEGYPNNFRYRLDDHILEVGTGRFGPVTPEVWNFEVSGLKVLRSWLGYRMANRKGRKSSPLDDIRPKTWVFTDELLRLITILQHTVDVTPTAAQLLDEIVNGPLLLAADLPQPTKAERKPPKV